MAETVGDIMINITANGSQVKGEMDKIKTQVEQTVNDVDKKVNNGAKQSSDTTKKGAEDAARGVQQGTDKIQKDVEKTSETARKGADTIGNSSTKMGDSFTKAGNRISEAGKKIKKALKTDAALAFAVVGAAATNFAKQCIDSAIKSESAWKRFGAIVNQQGGNWSKQEGEIKGWARTFSNNMGYAVSDTREASLSLLQFGMDAKNLEPAMRGVAGLAARTGMSEAEASKVVVSAMAGRGTQLKKLTGLSVDAYNKCKTEADQLRLLSDLYKQNEEALREHGETTEAQLTRVDNSWGRLKVEIGNSLMPTIKMMADVLWTVSEAFTNLPDPVKQFISMLLLVGGAVSVLIGVAGMLAPGLIAIGEAIGGVSGAIAFLTGPIGIVIISIVALVGVLYYLYNTNEDVRNALNSFASWLTSAFASAWSSLAPVIQELWNWLVDVGSAVSSMIGPALADLGNQLQPLGDAFGDLVGAIQEWWMALTGTDTSGASEKFNTLATVGNILKEVILVLARILGGELMIAFTVITTTVQGVVQGLTLLFQISTSIITTFQNLFTSISAGISRVQQVVQNIRNIFSTVVTTIRNKLSQARLIALVYAGAIRLAIVTRIQSLVSRIRTFFSNIVSTIRSRMSSAANSARQKALEIYNGIKNKVSQIPQMVYNEFIKIKDKIQSAIDSAKQVAVSKITDLVNAVKRALGIASPGYIQRMVTWEFSSLAPIIADKGIAAAQTSGSMAKRIVDAWEGNMTSLGVQFDEFNPVNVGMNVQTQSIDELATIGMNLATTRGTLSQSTQYTNSVNNDNTTTVYNIDKVTFDTNTLDVNGKQLFYDVLNEISRQGVR